VKQISFVWAAWLQDHMMIMLAEFPACLMTYADIYAESL